MNEIDTFISYLFDNIDNENINISKKIKDGFRIYNLSLRLENKNTFGLQNGIKGLSSYNDTVIIIDNYNKCIEFTSGLYDSIIIEDNDLLKKWSDLFEDYLNSNLNNTVTKLINCLFDDANNKSILRDYKFKKINI